MTIKEAIEKYNYINYLITDIKDTIGPILNQDTGPLQQYRINSGDMAKIVIYLNKYIEVLENRLEEEFK